MIPALLLVALTVVYAGANHSANQSLYHVNHSGPLPPGALVIVSPQVVAQMSVGSTFSVQVQVMSMSSFNGWDIQFYADPGVLNATSLSIAGNDFAVNDSAGSPLEFIHCVNGKGSGCTSSDHIGLVHSAYSNSGIIPFNGRGANGLLFTITYKVLSNAPYSFLALQNDLVADPTSGSNVPHTPVSGTYGFASVSGGSAGSHPWAV